MVWTDPIAGATSTDVEYRCWHRLGREALNVLVEEEHRTLAGLVDVAASASARQELAVRRWRGQRRRRDGLGCG